jgi:serine protease Do
MRHIGYVVFTVLAMSCTSAAVAADGEPKGLLPGFRDAVRKAKPAVVYIESTIRTREGNHSGYDKARGSGVIIDAKKGYVLTAAHVVDEAIEVTVRLEDGRKLTAKNIWGDIQSDVGLVQIDAPNLPEAALGDSDKLEVGDWVLAIGSPFGRVLENSVSAGIVSAKGRRTGVLGQMGVEDFIQTDAVINRGNSGGPLVNTDGQVVGINSNIISSTGMNAGLGFAVPSKLAKVAIEQLIKGGKVVRGYMGVSLSNLGEVSPAEAEKIPESIKKRGGAYVAVVVPDGPASNAGMKNGDVILSLDDKRIENSSDLIEYVSGKMPGDAVKCEIWRAGKTILLRARLTERPGNERVTADVSDQIRNMPSYRSIGVAVSDFAGMVIEGGRVSRVRGASVDYVKEDSPAEKSGIQAGEVIEEVDGTPVPDSRAFARALKTADLNKGVALTIINRNGQRQVVVRKQEQP